LKSLNRRDSYKKTSLKSGRDQTTRFLQPVNQQCRR